MAKRTNVSLRNQIIYQVFPRQHSKSHDFRGVINDLDRIKDLGTDIIYLLPIHEIGKIDQKGAMGCPYSIYDFRSINHELGTLEDFIELINETHKRKMKLIIDIVYNHTSRDSILTVEHPEWFYHKPDGSFANRVGDWSDVTDLNYQHQEQLDYLTDTLCYFVKIGVDGFRCDVAPLIDEKFWQQAIEACLKINPNLIWLSESVHLGFLKHIRDLGYEALSDSEIYNYFDILYDYDIYPFWETYNEGKTTLERYLSEIVRQESVYPKNYVKARYLENHDMPRAASYIKDPSKLLNATAMIYFLRGITFIYAGQEAINEIRPSLFEIDEVDWSNYNKYGIADLMKKMAQIKREPIFATGIFNATAKANNIAYLSYENKEQKYIGVFNLNNVDDFIETDLPDGTYQNIINNDVIKVTDGKIKTSLNPIVIKLNY